MNLAGRLGRVGLAVVASLGLWAGSAGAQGVSDPGDLAFWQSVQGSKNAAELQAYLQTYPNGRFAELARIRITALQGGNAQTGPGPAPEPDSEYKITLSPPNGRVGQRFRIGCVNFPDPNSYDQLVIVPAGTPVMDPTRSQDQTRVLWRAYIGQCGNSPEAGPFAPGAYEARWMSTLFNNDYPTRYEMKAMTAFTVR